MKIILIVSVLLVFGNVCSSYAIDCMDLWDEESIAEMIEDDRQYEELLRTGRNHNDEDEVEEHEDVHNSEDHEADPNEEDEEESKHDHEYDQHSERSVPQTEDDHRHKRNVPAAEEPVVSQLLNEESADLETAETHLFRPVFRYKSQYTERRRVRTPNGGGGANFAPSQS